MSELKEHQFCKSDEFFREYHEPLSNETHLYYLKSEVDKVIAELKADYKEACDRLQTANLIKDEQLAATRHSNHKRCLAMAMWCDSEMNYWYDRIEMEQCQRFRFYNKWHNRWTILAKKFKEAK